LNPNKILVPLYLPDRVDVVTVLPADFNMDGAVGVPDLIRWASNFGATDGTFQQGDADQDGLIGVPDLIRWAERFGTSEAQFPPPPLSALSGAVAIPEPGTLTLLWLGVSAVARRRKRGGRGDDRRGAGVRGLGDGGVTLTDRGRKTRRRSCRRSGRVRSG
jgi:hypothetical protein